MGLLLKALIGAAVVVLIGAVVAWALVYATFFACNNY